MNAVAGRIEAAEGGLAGRRLLYCVGAQRAGTSWLDAMFRGHPELHAPILKEVHYWDAIRPPHARWYRAQGRAGARLVSAAPRCGSGRAAITLRALVNGRAVERLLAARTGLYEAPSPDHASYAALLLDGSRPGQVVVDNTPGYALLGSDDLRGDGGGRRRPLPLRDARPGGAAAGPGSSIGCAPGSMRGRSRRRPSPHGSPRRLEATRRPRPGALGLRADDRRAGGGGAGVAAALPVPRDAVQPGGL